MLRAARRGLNKIIGFGLSMALLAIASLVAIPLMVQASGAVAWGLIATGQAIGAIAAVAVAYGWGMSGPATIARADFSDRVTEYAESVVCKLLLFVPIGLTAVGIAWLIGRDHGVFAGVGALSTASAGLTANWVFVGLAQPYALLLGETVPRIVGTGIGITLMATGSSALIGVLWQLIGMVAAFLICTLWILRPWDAAYRRAVDRRPVKTVLWAQRHGLTATLVSALYSAAPIMIVTIVAPAVQPVYAVLDKVQRQVNAGLSPFTTVMQGWIPRAARGALASRVRWALVLTMVCSLALTAGMIVVAPELLRWLGGGQIHPPFVALLLMATIAGVYLFENVVAKAALPALDRLSVAVRASIAGMVVGLPAVVFAAHRFGVEGALAGTLVGIIVRLVVESLALGSARKIGERNADKRRGEIAEMGVDTI